MSYIVAQECCFILANGLRVWGGRWAKSTLSWIISSIRTLRGGVATECWKLHLGSEPQGLPFVWRELAVRGCCNMVPFYMYVARFHALLLTVEFAVDLGSGLRWGRPASVVLPSNLPSSLCRSTAFSRGRDSIWNWRIIMKGFAVHKARQPTDLEIKVVWDITLLSKQETIYTRHIITSQKTWIFSNTAVRNSYLAEYDLFHLTAHRSTRWPVNMRDFTTRMEHSCRIYLTTCDARSIKYIE